MHLWWVLVEPSHLLPTALYFLSYFKFWIYLPHSYGISHFKKIQQQKSQFDSKVPIWYPVPIFSISIQGAQVIFAIHTLRINMQEVSYSTNFAKSSCFPKITNSDVRRLFLDLFELKKHIATLIWLTLLVDTSKA